MLLSPAGSNLILAVATAGLCSVPSAAASSSCRLFARASSYDSWGYAPYPPSAGRFSRRDLQFLDVGAREVGKIIGWIMKRNRKRWFNISWCFSQSKENEMRKFKCFQTLTLLERGVGGSIRQLHRRFALDLRLDSLDFQNLQQLVDGWLRNFKGLRPVEDLLHGDVGRTSKLRAARQKLFERLELDVYQFINLLLIVFGACYGYGDWQGRRRWRNQLRITRNDDCVAGFSLLQVYVRLLADWRYRYVLVFDFVEDLEVKENE